MDYWGPKATKLHMAPRGYTATKTSIKGYQQKGYTIPLPFAIHFANIGIDLM